MLSIFSIKCGCWSPSRVLLSPIRLESLLPSLCESFWCYLSQHWLDFFPCSGQVWNSAAQVADAYQIGRVESNAAINLHTKVNPEIIDRLAFLVKNLGHVDIKFFRNIKTMSIQNNVNLQNLAVAQDNAMMSGNGRSARCWHMRALPVGLGTRISLLGVPAWQHGKSIWLLQTVFCTWLWTEWKTTMMQPIWRWENHMDWRRSTLRLRLSLPLLVSKKSTGRSLPSPSHLLAALQEFVQRCSGAFLACMDKFEADFPPDFVRAEKPTLNKSSFWSIDHCFKFAVHLSQTEPCVEHNMII